VDITSILTIPELTLPAALGPFMAFLVAAILRRDWSNTARRWVAISVTAAVATLVLLTSPETRSETTLDWVAGISVAIAACHVTFALLKPTGIYDKIEWFTNGRPTPETPEAQSDADGTETPEAASGADRPEIL